MMRIINESIVRTFCIFLLGLSTAACASPSPVFYSLADREIYISPRPHDLNLAVAVLEDRRSPEEKAWAARFKMPSDLTGAVNDRMVRHLRASSVFSRVQILPGPTGPPSPDRFHELIPQGVDAVLVGELTHFVGRTDSDRGIDGHVQISDLKLYSTHTGRILWQGESDKRIHRQEINPRGDDFYAREALRGAINQLAIQLSALTFSHDEVYLSELPEVRQWRVAVLLPEDLRPMEERNPEIRKLQGNMYYDLYSHDNKNINGSFTNELAVRLAQKLEGAELFGNVISILSRGASSEEFRDWKDKGVDAVLTSELAHGYAAVTPMIDEKPFQIWSGGIGFHPVFKATATIRMENIRLIDTRGEKLLWKGEADFGIDRTLHVWKSPNQILVESVSGALDRLVTQLSQAPPFPNQKEPVSLMGLKTYSNLVR